MNALKHFCCCLQSYPCNGGDNQQWTVRAPPHPYSQRGSCVVVPHARGRIHTPSAAAVLLFLTRAAAGQR